MAGPIRLDLGCGNKRTEGWIAVDQAGNYSGVQPDIPCDLKSIPLPDDYADEARAIHVIEHFYRWEVLEVLGEWVRVLKPGAQLTLECPSLEKVLALANVPQCPPNMTYWALYGDPRYKDPSMVHKWCYGTMELAKLMSAAGLVGIKPEPPQFHQPIRDQRLVGFKPVPERLVIAADARGQPR